MQTHVVECMIINCFHEKYLVLIFHSHENYANLKHNDLQSMLTFLGLNDHFDLMSTQTNRPKSA